MRNQILSLLVLASLQAGAQNPSIPKNVFVALDRVDSNAIRGHVAFLADDKLKGRLPGTEGYQMAVDYVSQQFRDMGIRPAGDAGGFTQKLVIRKSILVNSSATAVLEDARGNRDSLRFAFDFFPEPHPLQPSASARGQMVFAGYGVDVPGGYSDYSGLDVAGKIVVVITGAPDNLPSTLQAHFSNAGNKMATAAAKGAAGLIVISPTAQNPGNTAAVVQNNVALNPAKTVAYGRRFTGNLPAVINGGRSLLNRLFFNSGHQVEEVLASLKKAKTVSFVLPQQSISISYKTTHQDIESYNVVGLIPGSDRRLKDEYVVHSAHLDHLGIGKPVDGDSIYNGAHDNASGVASLLEIARIYRNANAKPKRSVLVVLVTGEEMGLIGSSYFAANPTVPKDHIVADVNTDMPTVIAPLLSVVPLGAEHSTLMGHVRFAAGKLGLDVENDPEPSENRFVRSDQYSFVMSGIPALHIKYGNKTATPGTTLVDFVKTWRAKYYHKPQDGMNGIFNWTAARTYVQLNFLISWSVANTVERPQWNPGDLFATAGK